MANKFDLKNSNLFKIIFMIAFVVIGIFIFKRISPATIRHIIQTHKYAEVIFVLMWVFLPMFMFPVAILALAGGMGFGLIKGSILTFIGASLNLSLTFLLSRYLFREPVQKFLFKRYPESKEIIFANQKRLRISLILARLIPLIPYTVENYAFSLTDIDFFEYLVISLVLILPGTIIYNNVGDKSISPNSPDFIISIVLLIILVFGTAIFGRWYNQRDKKKNSDKSN